MLNIVAWPIELRIALVLLAGLALARFINWAIYTWAYFPKALGPWSLPTETSKTSVAKSSKGKKSKSKPSQSVRSWHDHLPIVGWWRLRRESDQHGERYWIRPLLIELFYPLALAWYYKFQISAGGLPPGAARLVLPIDLHIQFVGHSVLLTMMMIATFIDFDEQSIPDYVTIPGTIIGIVGAAFAPLWLPLNVGLTGTIAELDFAWPAPIPAWIYTTTGLAVALGILLVWGFGLLDRRIILRRGLSKAVIYFWARMFRYRAFWLTVLGVTAALMIFVACCWNMSIVRWPMLFSSLLGLAFAGGITWAVRISASYAYGVEALGFGDVTLMAMIGAYIGWQASLVVFFLAPFVAMLFVLIRWIVTRKTSTPYGPYLCGAVVVLLVGWNPLWTSRFSNLFIMADDMALMLNEKYSTTSLSGMTLVVIGVLVCVFLIGAMLWIWQQVKRLILGADPDASST